MNLNDVCSNVKELTAEVREFIKSEGISFDSSKIEHKGKNDLVSYVDKEAEKLLVKKLRQILPEAGFITEEATVSSEEKELMWVIDPLDGTTNFMHKVPSFSISVALLQNGIPVAGVVHEVNLNECFSATKGGGAYCNGKKIQISNVITLDEALIATGFPYRLLDKTERYFEIIKEFVKNSHGVRRLGSAAVDLAYVAAGRFEGYFEFNLKVWDVAAGVLLVQEAGGKVTDFSGGNDYLFGKELLASGHIHAEMLSVIKKEWFK